MFAAQAVDFTSAKVSWHGKAKSQHTYWRTLSGGTHDTAPAATMHMVAQLMKQHTQTAEQALVYPWGWQPSTPQ